MKSIYHRIFCFGLACFMLLGMTACTTAEDVEEESEGMSESAYIREPFEFDKSEPQYYMSKNSAASEKGYYYITGEPVSSNGIDYLYFYDIENGNQYPLCSKGDCEHGDETCDAHRILDNILSDTVWYYQDRLYMVERTEEYDRLISYDLYGRDRQNHTVLSLDGQSVFTRELTDSMCFNDGYIYYMINNAPSLSLYRAGIAGNSAPELVKAYELPKDSLPQFTLSALPDRVYINFSVKSYKTAVSSYSLDYYDIKSNRVEEVYKTDSEKNSEILDWNNILFDEVGNMYYATVTETQFIVNRLNIPTKKTEKFFSMECDNTRAGRGINSATDADYMRLESFDGTYFYISKVVNPLRTVKDFKKTTVDYGIENPKTMTTEVNTNYIFALGKTGKCVNVFPFKETGLKETASRQQGTLQPVFVCGDSRYLLISFRVDGSTQIEGCELTDEKYLKRFQELSKEYGQSPNALNLCMAIQLVSSKGGGLDKDRTTWFNLSNKIFTYNKVIGAK